MIKNHILVFGDVVRDPDNGKLLVAVSGSSASKTSRNYALFLEVCEEFNCLKNQLFPHDSTVVKKFVIQKNIKARISPYLEVMKIAHNKDIIRSFRFQVKWPNGAHK